MLPKRPLLKPWYRIANVREGVALEYGGSLLSFEGKASERLLPALLPLLNGERTLDDISAYLGEPVTPAIENALAILVDSGAVVEGCETAAELARPGAEAVEFLAAGTGATIAEVIGALERSSVGIAGSGARAEEIARLLRLSGVLRVERLAWSYPGASDDGLDLVVAAPGPSELPRLEEFNRLALGAGFPWLQALPFDGRFAAIGPLYVPGESCCYECFRLRRAANVGYREEFWALERRPASYPSGPPLESALAGLASVLALRWLVRRDPFLPGILHALEYGSNFGLTVHTVYRVPRCPACSGLEDLAPPLPWYEAVGG